MNAIVMPDPAVFMPPSDSLYEVVNGQRVELTSMGANATQTASDLHVFLGPFVRQRRLGKTNLDMLYILDPAANLRRRPDLAFVAAERWPFEQPPPPSGDWQIVPDLAVEVVSPNDAFDDVIGKVDEYFTHGVRQVWVIAPNYKLIFIYDSLTRVRVLGENDELTDTVVPGFTLKLAELFPRPAA